METQSQFAWINLYQEIADRLLEYRNDRVDLIHLIDAVYHSIGIKLPRLDSANPPIDIDPFTVFGLFNKRITDNNRVAIFGGFKEAIGLKSAIPDTFDGIPVLNNLNATFYRFADDPERGEHDIENLWRLFEEALKYADDGRAGDDESFTEAFDAVRLLKGNRWKLSMGLYWSRPRSFLNLDSRNRWYITERSGFPSHLIDKISSSRELPIAVDYLQICADTMAEIESDKYQFRSFPELSHVAWSVSQQVNDEIKAAEKAAEVRVDPILSDSDSESIRYWLYSPGKNANEWNENQASEMMAIGWSAIGDLGEYETRDDIRKAMDEEFGGASTHDNDVKAAWQFVHDIKEGDVVFAKRGANEIVGRGIVAGKYEHCASIVGDYVNKRDVEWTHVGSWTYSAGNAPIKTLTDITMFTNDISQLNELFEEEGTDTSMRSIFDYTLYTKADFLSQVYMEESSYDTLTYLVRHKRNVILEGAPGVGKTYCAKRLAYSMMGMQDSSRVRMVQFHQSYAYEDFIEGFRPTAEGFELRKGAFYDFCKRAAEDDEREYFFIIDEINRGNLSKILGELFMLIEADKRGVELNLLYSNELFSVPENVLIIGTMNTADRSIALLDYALRRRFAFFQLTPGFEVGSFTAYRLSISNPAFGRLVDCIKRLNAAISNDDSLGEGFLIGHSYLCDFDIIKASTNNLRRVVDFEIVPLLKEYWYDDADSAREWTERLRDSLR